MTQVSYKAGGLLTLMEKFSTYFGAKLSHLVFVATEQLATTLQKNINAQAMAAAKATKAFLQRQRQRSLTSFTLLLSIRWNN